MLSNRPEEMAIVTIHNRIKWTREFELDGYVTMCFIDNQYWLIKQDN